MRRIAATLAVVGALLFSAGSAWAEETNDISDWLKSEGLGKYEEKFLNNDVTLSILPELTDAELKEIGIDTIGARKRILRKIYEEDLKAEIARLEKKLSERTALAQKELSDRDARLRELQDLYLLSDNQLVQARDLTARQSDKIGVLNRQILALRVQLARIERALDTSESKSEEQNVVIADLGRRLNLALAAKVEELAEYRSQFFGRLRQVLAGRKGFTIIGDRFVFQSEVLFGSGSAELGSGGKTKLNTFADVLKKVMTRIPKDLPWILQVDSHTDIIPIQTSRFPSNWELSAARAIEVVNYLVTQGIPPERLSATGYGQFQPLDRKNDEIAHRRNRRIELKLTQR